MSNESYFGYWTGTISGTNSGGFTLEIGLDGDRVKGIASFSEPSYGQYKYLIHHADTKDGLSLDLRPFENSSSAILGNVKVIGKLRTDGKLTGKWASDIGTQGTFIAEKYESDAIDAELPKENSVFLVHGHDDGTKHAEARFLEQIGVKPVILHEQINRGMTIVEKFESYAKRAGFAVILMTPDDVGNAVGKEKSVQYRARQNVILELGYFSALLGRDKTMVLKKGDIEMPSDIFSIVYEPIDNSDGWKMKLAKELKNAGFQVSLDNAL